MSAPGHSGARARSAILAGGLAAGTIDIGSAAVIYRASPVVILHAIASGLLGRASYGGGLRTALLGLALQWFIGLVIAALYVSAAGYLPALVRHWVPFGIAYGVPIFVVMNYVVVPLSNSWPKHGFTPAKFAENLAALFLFGLIVAYFAKRFSARAPQTASGPPPSIAGSPAGEVKSSVRTGEPTRGTNAGTFAR